MKIDFLELSFFYLGHFTQHMLYISFTKGILLKRHSGAQTGYFSEASIAYHSTINVTLKGDSSARCFRTVVVVSKSQTGDKKKKPYVCQDEVS